MVKKEYLSIGTKIRLIEYPQLNKKYLNEIGTVIEIGGRVMGFACRIKLDNFDWDSLVYAKEIEFVNRVSAQLHFKFSG